MIITHKEEQTSILPGVLQYSGQKVKSLQPLLGTQYTQSPEFQAAANDQLCQMLLRGQGRCGLHGV